MCFGLLCSLTCFLVCTVRVLLNILHHIEWYQTWWISLRFTSCKFGFFLSKMTFPIHYNVQGATHIVIPQWIFAAMVTYLHLHGRHWVEIKGLSFDVWCSVEIMWVKGCKFVFGGGVKYMYFLDEQGENKALTRFLNDFLT